MLFCKDCRFHQPSLVDRCLRGRPPDRQDPVSGAFIPQSLYCTAERLPGGCGPEARFFEPKPPPFSLWGWLGKLLQFGCPP
jgi:hypothetical protein